LFSRVGNVRQIDCGVLGVTEVRTPSDAGALVADVDDAPAVLGATEFR